MTSNIAAPPVDIADTLTQASAWMFASIALQPPTAASAATLQRLIPSLPDSIRPTAEQIAAFPLDGWEPEYFSILGPAGCPACESSYERAAMVSRGPLLAAVSGCYSAFAYAPDVREVADHASIEAGFLAYLLMKIAFADHQGKAEAARITREAYEGFLRDHIAVWMGDFADALANTGSVLGTALTDLLQRLLADTADLEVCATPDCRGAGL